MSGSAVADAAGRHRRDRGDKRKATRGNAGAITLLGDHRPISAVDAADRVGVARKIRRSAVIAGGVGLMMEEA